MAGPLALLKYSCRRSSPCSVVQISMDRFLSTTGRGIPRDIPGMTLRCQCSTQPDLLTKSGACYTSTAGLVTRHDVCMQPRAVHKYPPHIAGGMADYFHRPHSIFLQPRSFPSPPRPDTCNSQTFTDSYPCDGFNSCGCRQRRS